MRSDSQVSASVSVADFPTLYIKTLFLAQLWLDIPGDTGRAHPTSAPLAYVRQSQELRAESTTEATAFLIVQVYMNNKGGTKWRWRHFTQLIESATTTLHKYHMTKIQQTHHVRDYNTAVVNVLTKFPGNYFTN